MKNHNNKLLFKTPRPKKSHGVWSKAVISFVKSFILIIAFATHSLADINPMASVLSGNGYVVGTGPFTTVISTLFSSSTLESVDLIEFTAPAGVTLTHGLPSPSPYTGFLWSGTGDELPANGGANGISWGNPFFPAGGSVGDINAAPFAPLFINYTFGIDIDPGAVTGDFEIEITYYGDGNGELAPTVETITLTIVQFCAPEIIGDASVCTDQFSSYTVLGDAGSVFNWTLNPAGGTIVGPSTGTSIDVQWNSIPGGAYELRVNESNATNSCSGNSSIFVIIEGSVNMACNDTVQFSLDTICQGVITPDILLEGPEYEAASYQVVAYDQGGNQVPGNIVNGNYIGELLTVRVTHMCSGVSCWGYISIEDKIAPPLVCASDTIDCVQSTDPFDIGFPVPPTAFVTSGPGNSYLVSNFDACGGPVTLTYYDETENLQCDLMFSGIIYRNWTAEDESGNVSTCQDTIYSRSASIDDIVCPENYDDVDQPTIRCGSEFIMLPNGHPSPEETGYPIGVECNNIQYYFQDIRFDICGNSYKLLRHWVILDWCTGRDTVCDQIIKIIDDDQPIITCPQDGLTGTTDPWVCTGTLELPEPTIIFECSEWTYQVGYLLADESGNPPANGQYIIDENVTYNPDNNRYTITNLPVGRTWIKYSVRDDCGYITNCFTEVDIVDDEPPTAVCEASTVVSLSSDGLAAVFATSIDDNSIDNCAIDRVEIKRESDLCAFPGNLDFSEKIKVCCADVAGGTVKVRLRVYDVAGLYNECVVDLVVDDKQDPVITCPPNINLDCTLDRNNLAITGQATATDNCSAEVSFNDNEFLDECGIGYVNRVWTATDPGGRASACNQRIDIFNNDPLDETDVLWPPAITEVEGCTSADAHPDITGRPEVFASCIKLAISYEDQEYINVDDVCKKIRRTWTVVDWCNYDPHVPQIKFVQKIILSGSDDPEIVSDCSPKEVATLDNVDCEAFIDLTVSATDDCTPASELHYSYQIDFDSDGDPDIINLGNDASGFYPNGSHQVTYYVADGCGNVSSCTQDFRIIDTKSPTPLCISGISLVLLQDDESITIWAVDYNQKSFDNCTPDDELEFSFSTNVNDKGRTFTCADLPDGVKAEIPLQVYVTDEDGNQDFCSVQATILDNKNLCPDDPDASAMIAGRIADNSNLGIDAIEIRLADSEGEENMEMTEEEGNYAFDQLSLYRDYQVSPYKNDDVINGVSTLDLVLIQKHVLGLLELEAPFKLIAADVNNSASITASDLVQLRKLILGLYDEFPSNTSWRFIEEGFEFDDIYEPWDFPSNIIVNDLILNQMNGNFKGIKIGDVNGSAIASYLNSAAVSTRNEVVYTMEIVDKEFSEGDVVNVSFYSSDRKLIEGIQYTINFDPTILEYIGFERGAMELTEANLGLNRIAEGILTLSWDKIGGIEIEAEMILNQMKFRANSSARLSDALSLTSDVTKAELYDLQASIFNVEARFVDEDRGAEIEQLKVFDNYPDPFTHETRINFEIPETSQIVLTVYDLSGRLIMTKTGHYKAGLNNVTISSSDLPHNGVMYYQIKSEFGAITRKMIKID